MRVTATAVIPISASIAPPVTIRATRGARPAPGPASRRCWAAPPGFSPVSERWPDPASGQWSPRRRSPRPFPARSCRGGRRTDRGAGRGGIPREHANIYAEAVRRGGTLETVRTDDVLSDRVSDILIRHWPVDIEERAESWLKPADRASTSVRSLMPGGSPVRSAGPPPPARVSGRANAEGLGGEAGLQRGPP